jgi:serine/threonine protein kinase
MDHGNIVRYYQAWLEPDDVSLSLNQSNGTTMSNEDSTYMSGSSSQATAAMDPTKSLPHSKPHHVQLKNSELPMNRSLTLFIQMELCYSTLHDYLLHRNTLSLTPLELMNENHFIFQSLLIAIAYVHDRGMSHRDITPKNVFLLRQEKHNNGNRPCLASILKKAHSSETLEPLCLWMKCDSLDEVVVKLGDFGLVAEHSPSDAIQKPSKLSTDLRVETKCSPVVEPIISSPSYDSTRFSYRNSSPISAGDGADKWMGKDPVEFSIISGSESDLKSPSSSLNQTELNASSPIEAVVTLPISPLQTESPRKTRGVGTTTYAPPEQLQFLSKFEWHPIKSDMFSLGVILMELFCPFSTGMERVICLQRLKPPERHLPPEFIRLFPQHAAMVLWLTAEDPNQRPSPMELLRVFPPRPTTSAKGSPTSEGARSPKEKPIDERLLFPKSLGYSVTQQTNFAPEPGTSSNKPGPVISDATLIDGSLNELNKTEVDAKIFELQEKLDYLRNLYK